jgi:rhodanese-related sulfurtransferase
MIPLVKIESIYNAMDIGIFMESAVNAFKKKFDMDFRSFLRHLIFGKGYKELTPPELSRKQDFLNQDLLIVDLRDNKSFQKSHIKNAVLHPFDDFLGEILMNEGYAGYKQKHMVLVCDTGAKSRVAASILAEEGFMDVSSLNRGMRRWGRWEKLLLSCGQSRLKRFHICRYFL